MDHLFENVFINTKNSSFTIESDLEVNQKAEGVVLAMGGSFGGYSLYAQDGKLRFVYNYLGDEYFEIISKTNLKPGVQKVSAEFKYDGEGVGKGGFITLKVNGEAVANGRVEKTMPFVYSTSEGASVGWDDSSPVSKNYKAGKANAFNGTIDHVKISLQ
jgi:arylsulfatase